MSTYCVNAENRTTVKNLQTAFQSELRACETYKAYANRAEIDCAFEVAILFRAIARSEKIHADNHARVIRQLGGNPDATVHSLETKSTLDNLMAALEEEVYKIDMMYPRFLVENKSRTNSAGRSFTWAMEAEKSHALLLNEVITQMKQGVGSSSTGMGPEFYVRPVCGYISRSSDPERCWACEHFCKTFEVIR